MLAKLTYIEEILGEQNFLAGDQVTLADISLAVSVPYFKLVFAQHWTEKLEQWNKRVLAAVPSLKELNDQVNFKTLVQGLKDIKV